ncbi:hypothetical protein NHF46_21885 [Arthrobacter alpinus]|nr:hypothetical protein [Arthrobacter alpinus]
MDLGVEDNATYLIAARTSPADLLDLVVPTEPAEEVYQEPFFTDTLGTEILARPAMRPQSKTLTFTKTTLR